VKQNGSASCSDLPSGSLPAVHRLPRASHVTSNLAYNCEYETCSATPPPRRGLSSPFNYLPEGTVEDRSDGSFPELSGNIGGALWIYVATSARVWWIVPT
jgi:hypothetical protein